MNVGFIVCSPLEFWQHDVKAVFLAQDTGLLYQWLSATSAGQDQAGQCPRQQARRALSKLNHAREVNLPQCGIGSHTVQSCPVPGYLALANLLQGSPASGIKTSQCAADRWSAPAGDASLFLV